MCNIRHQNESIKVYLIWHWRIIIWIIYTGIFVVRHHMIWHLILRKVFVVKIWSKLTTRSGLFWTSPGHPYERIKHMLFIKVWINELINKPMVSDFKILNDSSCGSINENKRQTFDNKDRNLKIFHSRCSFNSYYFFHLPTPVATNFA